MNLGLFIENLGESQTANPVVDVANAATKMGKFRDVSIFYQDIGVLQNKAECGVFNSTDICHFSGLLVVTFLDGLKTALKEINNREIYYFYGLSNDKDLFGHLEALNDKSVKVVAKSEDVDYVKKKLGRSDVIACDSLDKILEVV